MDIEICKNSSVAVQVKFWDGENWCAGFMVGQRLVCGCCGGIFDVDEILEKYLKGLKFHYVQDIQEVIDFALVK